MFLKKTFLAAILISTYFLAQAQFQKGDFTIGAGANPLWMKSRSDFNYKKWNATLEGEYFSTNKISYGLALGIDAASTDSWKQRTASLDLFSRYYFLNNPMKKRKFQPYAEGYFRTEKLLKSSEGDYTKLNYGQPNIRAGLGIGMNYFLTKKFVLNAAFRYDRELISNPYQKNNMEIRIGMKYRF